MKIKELGFLSKSNFEAQFIDSFGSQTQGKSKAHTKLFQTLLLHFNHPQVLKL